MTGAGTIPAVQARYSGNVLVTVPIVLACLHHLCCGTCHRRRTCVTDRGIKMSGFKKRPFLPFIVLLALLFAGSHTVRAQTLNAVRERGTLNCGVGQGLLG